MPSYTSPLSTLPPWMEAILASPPKSGDGFNTWLLRTAGKLKTCHQSDDQIFELLRPIADVCGREVSNAEIERQIRLSVSTGETPSISTGSSDATRRRAPTRKLDFPPRNIERLKEVAAKGWGLETLVEASPIPMTSEGAPDTEEIISLLWPGNPLLCVGMRRESFQTRPREEWRGRLARRQFIVPSPMSAKYGETQEGRRSQHTLSNTGPRRFLVIESDLREDDPEIAPLLVDGKTLFDLSAAAVLTLGELSPLALVVHSAGKSLHAYFYCEGRTDAEMHPFMAEATALGADPRMWLRSQFARLPGGTRDGKRQVPLYLNPRVIRA